MRLTLRTLLAYLDDILEPAEARDMGAKVAESGMAQSMVNRIHEVMRRRRLLAPDVDGPGMGVDPNVVAEYLDNTLPSGDVADVEKVCLESDIHLAEVAACHQILTLVLGEPVEVVPRSRERMYALGPLAHTAAPASGNAPETGSPARNTAASRVAAAEVPAGSNGKRTEARTNGESRPAVVPMTTATPVSAPTGEDRIPEYLRSRPAWQKALPWVLGAGLVGSFAFLLLSDPDLGIRRKPAGAASGSATVVADETATTPAKDMVEFGAPATAVPVAPPPETVASVPVRPPAGSVPGEAVPIDAPPPVEPSEAKPAEPIPPPPEPNKKPAGSAKSEVVDNAVPLAPPPGGDVKGPDAGAMDAVTLKYDSAEGVLLHFRPKSGDWFLLPRRALIHSGETIAAPEPFESNLSIDDDRASVTILPGTAATVLGPTNTALIGFDIRQGRMIVQNKTVDDEAANQQPSLVFSLALGKGVWNVELKGSGATCGIDITPREPDGFEQNLGTATWSGRITVTTGSAVLTEPSGRRVTLDELHALPLEPVTEEVKLSASIPTETPRWMEQSSRRMSTTVRRNAILFEKEFDPAQSVALTVAALVNNPSVQQSELATKTLALTQNYPALVKALSQSPHKEVRMAAIAGLRTWLGASAKHGPLLAEELSKNFSPGDDTVIYGLLWGFSQDEAKDADKSAQLVDRLESEQLAVRELAFYHLHRITSMRYEYDAQLPPAQRMLSVNRWRTHLKREGGALLKK